MALNKSTGNMYPWVSHTWNPIKGRCPHACAYCFMWRAWNRLGESDLPRIVKKELYANLGHGKKIFVGSATDMWAEDILEMWDLLILAACQNHPGNDYFFQTKNPRRLHTFKNCIPQGSILGVTLETNREHPEISKAPSIAERAQWMVRLREETSFQLMISIEPVMDFDLDPFVSLIREIRPAFVSIGADSKRHNLPEPTLEKVGELLLALRAVAELRIKENLKRLL